MAKVKKNKKTKKTNNIQELFDSRKGGQIALRGYSYQFLFSCYLILSTKNTNTTFQLEGIEDIDCIQSIDGLNNITHIQLKYSENRQNASFMSDVLKNFLEAYLLDQNRSFKMVYDFTVAQGYLSKLIDSKLDSASMKYWEGIILEIKNNNPTWNWSEFDVHSFMSKLSFEKIEKRYLVSKIEDELIKNYDITTDNIELFANSIKILCFEKMVKRASISPKDIERQIEYVKSDIAKGHHNPAHSWIRKIAFTKTTDDINLSFYEGKKATPADIANELPVKRPELEKEIIDSIKCNTVTVIKASSGQGKTTLALRSTYILQNEYTIYQLIWCNDKKELGNIVQYFSTRVRMGEKILIFIDNLDNQLSEWNTLVQLLQSELPCNYKILITTRETDWYNYCGDLSNVQSIKTIKPVLNEKEAKEIYHLFWNAKKLHHDMNNWQKAWNMISDSQLLIEYVYLLTHGEMLSERIASQISEIGRSSTGKIKCNILRNVCFADICGLKLSVKKLSQCFSEDTGTDLGECLKSMESEFLVSVEKEHGYIGGLHPIRSKHIIDNLHEFYSLADTAISVIDIARKEDYPVLFSHLPEFDFALEEVCPKIVESLWKQNDLSIFISAIRGLFSGSAMKYYQMNHTLFDNANNHGGLYLFVTDLCPFLEFGEFGIGKTHLINTVGKTFPDNENIKYMLELLQDTTAFDIEGSFVNAFCNCLFDKLKSITVDELGDVESYASIAEWMYNINHSFNLSGNIRLDKIWNDPERYSIECISSLMLVCYYGNREDYNNCINNRIDTILAYLKKRTRSHRVYIDTKSNSIHTEYILRLCCLGNGNTESVSRIKYICKTLPIFNTYCADAYTPKIEALSAYMVTDEAHKEIPINKVVITFKQEMAQLWINTILSNYEFHTFTEWMNYWNNLRRIICSFEDKCCECIDKLLQHKLLGQTSKDIDKLRSDFQNLFFVEKRYPKQDNPFEEENGENRKSQDIPQTYFQSMNNFMNQLTGFLIRDENEQRLALYNLKICKSSLEKLQLCFEQLSDVYDIKQKHYEICSKERSNIDRLIMYCEYYKMQVPEKYYNKYQIEKWYKELCDAELRKTEEGLKDLQNQYAVHFPDTIFYIDAARYYPIIIEAKDNKILDIITRSTMFSESIYDYLVILTNKENNEIEHYAWMLRKKLFIDNKNRIKHDIDSIDAKLNLPIQIEVTKQMLECFADKYYTVQIIDNNDMGHIGNLAEDLWVLSKINELLSEPEDKDYREEEMYKIRKEIDESMHVLSDVLHNDDYLRLNKICEAVYAGDIFDDNAYNRFIEYFSQKYMDV